MSSYAVVHGYIDYKVELRETFTTNTDLFKFLWVKIPAPMKTHLVDGLQAIFDGLQAINDGLQAINDGKPSLTAAGGRGEGPRHGGKCFPQRPGDRT